MILLWRLIRSLSICFRGAIMTIMGIALRRAAMSGLGTDRGEARWG